MSPNCQSALKMAHFRVLNVAHFGTAPAEAGGGRAPSDPQDIRWRAEHEKTGYEHRTPVTAEALAVLERARARSSGLETAAAHTPREPGAPAASGPHYPPMSGKRLRLPFTPIVTCLTIHPRPSSPANCRSAPSRSPPAATRAASRRHFPGPQSPIDRRQPAGRLQISSSSGS